MSTLENYTSRAAESLEIQSNLYFTDEESETQRD